MQLVGVTTQKHLASLHPEAAIEIDNLQRVLSESSVDAALLDLCSRYFRAALRDDSGGGMPSAESSLEEDCLAVCEQFMVSVSTLSGEQMAALARHMSADDLYNLMYAIYLIEMSQRLELTLEGVLQ